ncbi:acyl-CoA dehydrogenase family protein [Chloroflexota bacterium]
MDFNLTEEQLMIQRMAKEFAEREIEPIAAEIDQKARLPDDMIKKMAQVDLLGMTVPQKYGGTGAGVLSATLALEQLAYPGTGAWWIVGFNNSIPGCIAHFGSEEIKQKYLRPLCDGTAYASIQFTEPDTGSDPRMLVTTAMPDGDDYVINGVKRFSTFGARDGYATHYAKDETEKCTCFVIQKNVEGYKAEKIWELMGGGGIESADVYFEDMRVPKENILGEKGNGFTVLLHWIASEKLEQCAVNTGISQAALDESVKYAKERIVRERPMAAMQGIQWELAEMQVKINAMRWLTYRTAFLEDNEAPNWATEAAATKMFCIPASLDIVTQAVQLHGGYGYSKEFKVERLYRAAIGSSVIATSIEINRSIVGASLVR